MGFLNEFKSFALKGNVMDMAVGVIIGGAFGKIVTSFVNDILMPPLGLLLGNTDFTDLQVNLSEKFNMAVPEGAQPAIWKYGAFIQGCIDFIIMAFCVFLMVKFINKLTKKNAPAPAPAPAPSKEEVLLTEIRDILKEKK